MSEWNDRLTASLQDPAAFAGEIEQLKASNPDLPTLKALCLEFRGARATSKAHAYREIMARHESLMDAEARRKAQGGRSAA